MFSTTGLAVGLAIGVPTFVCLVVAGAFWYRQRLHYQKDLELHKDVDDYDEINDLDLDNMMASPRKQRQRHYSKERTPVDDEDSGSRNSESRRDINSNRRSYESEGNRFDEVNGEFVIKNGNYNIRKTSKIMGLRLVSKNNEGGNKNSNGVETPGSKLSLATKNDNNFKTYYESMIPVFDGNTHAEESSSTFNEKDLKMNPAMTPSKVNNHQSHSSMDLYKLLQEDSPIFPRAMVNSSSLGDFTSPLKKSSDKSLSIASGSPVKSKGVENSNVNNHNVNFTADTESLPKSEPFHVSPFDTPPARKKLILNLEDNSSYEQDDINIESNAESGSDDMHDAPYSRHASPSKGNLHKRNKSADSYQVLEDEENLAEQTHDRKRKEWLDTYRKL